MYTCSRYVSPAYRSNTVWLESAFKATGKGTEVENHEYQNLEFSCWLTLIGLIVEEFRSSGKIKNKELNL